MARRLLLCLYLVACSGEDAPQVCYPGQLRCRADGAVDLCNEGGTGYVAGACAADQKCIASACDDPEECPDVCKDIMCEPGQRACAEDNVFLYTCDATGTALIACGSCAAPPINGVCYNGGCVSLCGAAQKTYIGCEYFAADLDNAFVFAGSDPIFGNPNFLDAENAQFAVVVSNPDPNISAYVSVTRGPPTGAPPDPNSCTPPEPDQSFVASAVVPPRGLHIFELPSRNIQGTSKQQRSYRVAANVPITAYQFNPLENADVFSNDASLLLPTTAIGNEYYVMTREQSFDILKGFLTVAAVDPDEPTLVTVRVTAETYPGNGIPALHPGDSFTTTLEQYDVLNIETDAIGADLTGSYVTADKPVVVFGGSEAANAPNTSRCDAASRTCEADPGQPCACTAAGGAQSCMRKNDEGYEVRCKAGDTDCYSHALCSNFITCCADHLEMQLFPVSAWGSEYVGVRSFPRREEVDVWRILSANPDTVVTLTPAVAEVPVLGVGQWFEFETGQDFLVESSKPVLVGQFLAAQDAPGSGAGPGDAGTGDPSFMLLPPVRQLRTEYVFLAPNRYASDFISVAAPLGGDVELDGVAVELLPLADVVDIPGTTWRAARLPISDGYHELICPATCSVMVHGYDQYVSYGYPGGLDLEDEETP